jgi:CHAT domain-containing protein
LLAADAAIVEYCIGTGVVAFLITPARFEVVPIPATREELRRAVESDDHTLLEAALIAPVRQFLAGVSTIAIVPDRFLSSVSFASVRNEGRHLIDDFVLVQSPSASVAIMASRVASRRVPRNLVAIAATDLDHARYPTLARIDGAEREAMAIASLHPGSELILGTQATPRRLIEAASRFDLVHFAGHALADSRIPAASRLLLSGGELNAAGISRLRLNNTPIVVLAACRTAQNTESRDGVANLAVAFLIAGAPVVVAGALDLDDRTTAEFDVRFLRNLLRHGDAAEALRQTVRAEDKMDKRLASISVFGGSSRLVRPIERRER